MTKPALLRRRSTQHSLGRFFEGWPAPGQNPNPVRPPTPGTSQRCAYTPGDHPAVRCCRVAGRQADNRPYAVELSKPTEPAAPLRADHPPDRPLPQSAAMVGTRVGSHGRGSCRAARTTASNGCRSRIVVAYRRSGAVTPIGSEPCPDTSHQGPALAPSRRGRTTRLAFSQRPSHAVTVSSYTTPCRLPLCMIISPLDRTVAVDSPVSVMTMISVPE
jgi:hypothetical protein